VASTKSNRPARAKNFLSVFLSVKLATSLNEQVTSQMPRDGAILFGDLIGKLGSPHVACTKCERAGAIACRT
jgi:hypothetical protein